MKKLFIKLRSQKVALVALALALVGTSVYGYMQITGLKRRATTVENRLNVAGFYAETPDAQSDTGGLELTVVSQKDTTIKVYGTDLKYEGMGDMEVVDKKVRAVVVRVKNTNDTPFDFGGNITAQIENDGRMISLVEPATEDAAYQPSYFAIAPRSEVETTLYFEVAADKKIMKLYDNNWQKSYDL
jgi:hypothetical protein